MSLLLRCPLCRKLCSTIECRRSHRDPGDVEITVFHSNANAPACRGRLSPTRAASALKAGPIETESVRNQHTDGYQP